MNSVRGTLTWSALPDWRDSSSLARRLLEADGDALWNMLAVHVAMNSMAWRWPNEYWKIQKFNDRLTNEIAYELWLRADIYRIRGAIRHHFREALA